MSIFTTFSPSAKIQYPLKPTPSPPFLWAPANFSLNASNYSRHFIYMQSHCICPPETGLFCRAKHLQCMSMLQQMPELLWLFLEKESIKVFLLKKPLHYGWAADGCNRTYLLKEAEQGVHPVYSGMCSPWEKYTSLLFIEPRGFQIDTIVSHHILFFLQEISIL